MLLGGGQRGAQTLVEDKLMFTSTPYNARLFQWALASLFLATLVVGACSMRQNSPQQPPPGNPGIDPTACSAAQEWCQGRCVDSITFVNDTNNCGRCGNRCSFSETCRGGFCACGPGYEQCMGSCVSSASFISDSQNCGRCGNSCPAGESCLGGRCRKL